MPTEGFEASVLLLERLGMARASWWRMKIATVDSFRVQGAATCVEMCQVPLDIYMSSVATIQSARMNGLCCHNVPIYD